MVERQEAGRNRNIEVGEMIVKAEQLWGEEDSGPKQCYWEAVVIQEVQNLVDTSDNVPVVVLSSNSLHPV